MKIDIEYISKLAALSLSDEETMIFLPQLNQILEFINKLNECDTQDIDPTFQVTGKINEFRDDIPQDSLSQKDAISNANQTKDGYIVTKGVFDEST